MRRILAYHIIFGCYGFWLPNDPRGSWSNYVGSQKLYFNAGAATKVDTDRSLAHVPHDNAQRLDAKSLLKFPPVVFNGLQARAVARGFTLAVAETKMNVFACSVMPNHVHLVFAEHPRGADSLVLQLKSRATKRLSIEHIAFDRSPWARGYWEVRLFSDDDVLRAVEYVEQNPVKDGFKPQCWPFVVPYR